MENFLFLGVPILKLNTVCIFTLLHSERPKLHAILAFLSEKGFKQRELQINLHYESLESEALPFSV